MLHVVLLLLVIAAIIHLGIGMWWIAVILSVMATVIWLALSEHRLAKKIRYKTSLLFIVLAIASLALGISVQMLIFGICYIPSDSMENTLVAGDRVWLNKMSYGPLLPQSPMEIPWFNVAYWLAKNRDTSSSKVWGKHRLKGYGKPQCNHVVVFMPPCDSIPYIKRCIALPGDTLQIEKGTVYINGKPMPFPDNGLRSYELAAQKGASLLDLYNSLGISRMPFFKADSTMAINLTVKEAQGLALNPKVGQWHLWHQIPQNLKQEAWNADSYGPLIIPYKGMRIPSDSVGFRAIYETLIADYETPAMGDSAFTFSHDYYFMLGDNWYGSYDSRYFGPVPMENIVGKATFIIGNKNNLKHRWLKNIK